MTRPIDLSAIENQIPVVRDGLAIICRYRKVPTMSIPARPDSDFDLVLHRMLDDLPACVAWMREAALMLRMARGGWILNAEATDALLSRLAPANEGTKE